ncbi:MAG: helix-hairpin-helix domain-containing protein [Halanaerobium sp.]|nr:helix-hairpin-helix domain-containing protein [Halanaerobium sp.]
MKFGKRKEDIIYLLVLTIVLFGVGFFFTFRGRFNLIPARVPGIEVTEAAPQESNGCSETIYVHITGAVKSPGVYQLKEEARVIDALKAAGGLSPLGSPDSLNLAARLRDGQRLFVPFLEESAEEGKNPAGYQVSRSENQGSDGGLININTASKEELTSLPGIGPAKAEDIISYREKEGGFTAVEDITRISGIGPKTLASLRKLITVD